MTDFKLPHWTLRWEEMWTISSHKMIQASSSTPMNQTCFFISCTLNFDMYSFFFLFCLSQHPKFYISVPNKSSLSIYLPMCLGAHTYMYLYMHICLLLWLHNREKISKYISLESEYILRDYTKIPLTSFTSEQWVVYLKWPINFFITLFLSNVCQYEVILWQELWRV